jgi:hypothetical protein
MAWTVETLNETVDAELADLPADMRARLVRISELIESVGLLNGEGATRSALSVGCSGRFVSRGKAASHAPSTLPRRSSAW